MFYVPQPGGAGTTFYAWAKYMKNITFDTGSSYGWPAETLPYFWLNK